MAESLKQKAVNSIGWNMAETFSLYFVRFFIGVILARLLTPADFGLIGMVTIFFSFSDVFITAGFGQALIQKKDITKEDANTAFVINFVLGLFIYLVLFLCAPAISVFFNQPQLIELIRVLALVVVINSLNMVQYALMRKELQFKRKSIITVVAVVVSGITGIICAIKGFGVWSLVIQQMTNAVLTCSLFHITSAWRLSFHFSIESFKALFSKGSWLLFSNLIASVFNSFYRFVIGRFFSPADLGLYDRSNQLQSMVSENVVQSVGMVAFPVFSKIQDDPLALKKTVAQFVTYSSFITFPLLAILYVVAEPFVDLLLTSKWLGLVPYLKIMCIIGLFIPANKFLGPLLQGIGRVKTALIFVMINCILRIINVLFSYSYGISGFLVGEIFVLILSIAITSIYAQKRIGFNYLFVFYEIRWIIVATVLSSVFGSFIFTFCESNPYVAVLIPSIVMVLIYLLVLFIMQRSLLAATLSVFGKTIKR